LIYNGKTIQREHIDDYLPKCSNKKYSLSVWYIQFKERQILIDLPYII
jgi:hypothetical protein